MFQFINKNKILAVYKEYKEQFRLDMIEIVPKVTDASAGEMAYTDNEQLINCINNKMPVTLYYNEKLFGCSKEYIKAILYHEFTHISDCYNFVGYEYSNFLMSTYSEYNAMKREFFMRCSEQLVPLDYKILGENEKTTPRKEIEDYLNFIISVTNVDIQDRIGEVVNMFTKQISWMFALLSYYEKSEPKYFQSCFDRMNNSYRFVAKRLYYEVQDIDEIKKNPDELVSTLLELISICIMKEENP